MEKIFLNAVNLSITAGWIVLAVILLRFIFKKAPKWISCLLWALVGIRLVCPFSIESILSLIPSQQTLPDELITSSNPYYYTVDSGIEAINRAANPVLRDTSPSAMVNNIFIFSCIWLAGIAAMLIYSAVTYIMLKRRVRASTPLCGNVRLCESVVSPFILGFIRPQIYLPYGMEEKAQESVLAHERAHLKRRDHLIKPVAFLILSVYWFNPLLWVAYVLLCRDIELACDEQVVKDMTYGERQSYSRALLENSVNRRMLSACPLAFGEVGVKARIKSVMSYKKPAFWVVIAAVIVSLIASVCLLTSPESGKNSDYQSLDCYTDCEGVDISITDMYLNSDEPYLSIEITNKTGKDLTYGDEFHLYKHSLLGKSDLCEGHYWDAIAYSISGTKGERKFSLSGFNVDKIGKYSLEFEFCLGENDKTKYTAYIGFERINSELISGKYQTNAMIYIDESFSSVPDVSEFPVYEFAGGAMFTVDRYAIESSVTYHIGNLQRTGLTKDSFDGLFKNTSHWEEKLTPEKVRKANEAAWRVEDISDSEDFYYILRQQNGDVYLCFGFYDMAKPYIRWMIRFKTPISVEASEENYTSEMTFVGYNSEAKNKIFEKAINKKDMYLSSAEQLPMIKIDSIEALESFKNEFSGSLMLDKSLDGYKSFNVAVTDCDGDFFKKNSLVLTYIQAGSTDYRYEQSNLFCDGEYFQLRFTRTSPPVGNTAMGGWICVTKINSGIIADCKDFSSVLSHQLVFNTYKYVNGKGDSATLIINEDKTFQFNYSSLSSYISTGSYELADNLIILTDKSDKGGKYTFEMAGGSLVFMADKSTDLPKYSYSAQSADTEPVVCVPDGAVFEYSY